MTVKLNAATGGGSVSLSAPNSTTSNADVTLTLPPNDGDASQYLQTDGAGALSWQTITDDPGAEWTDGTSTSTSGSASYSFTGLPDNVREIVITVLDVSWSSSTNLKFRLRTGNADYTTADYHSKYSYMYSSVTTGGGTANTSFILGTQTSASHQIVGTIRFTNTTGDTWVANGQFTTRFALETNLLTGEVDIGGTLDGVTIFVSTGTLDGGSFNIHYITT